MTEATRRTTGKRKRPWPFRRLRFRLVLSMYVLVGMLMASPAQAITATFGDIEITPKPAPQATSSHGYFEYVFLVANTSAEHSHIVSLTLPFEKQYANGDSIRELRRTVQVGANETVHVSLLQPDYPPLGGKDVAVTIDGRRQDHELPLRPNQSMTPQGFYRGGYASTVPAGLSQPLILLGQQVNPLPKTDTMPGGPVMAGPPGGHPMPPGMVQPERRPPGGMPPVPPPGMMSEKMPPGKPGLPQHGYQFVTAENWSDNWLAYSRYDGIIVTAGELNSLPAGVRVALWRYVETGGSLLVLGRTDLRGLSAEAEIKDEAGWQSIQAGFGQCRISPDANYDNWNSERFSKLMEDWRKPAAPWSTSRRSTYTANSEFPVIEDLGIPVKGLFILMFLFTLGIGPINVLVLSRLKRRIWLLWTTPVISLFTCLAVFGFMLISEGWRGQLRSETLTLLDETTHRATTIGWTGIYSPLTPSDGLHFSYETEVVPQRYHEGRRGGARSCTLDWSQDQHFASGWVEARVPAHFKVRKSELRRERVAIQQEPDGRWSIVNGLGTAIHRFWYADAKGQIHIAENLAPGARSLLTLTEKECQATAKPMQSILSGNWMAGMQQMTAFPQHYLLPKTYLAEVNDSPFLEDSLSNARTRRLHALVMGFGKQGE